MRCVIRARLIRPSRSSRRWIAWNIDRARLYHRGSMARSRARSIGFHLTTLVLAAVVPVLTLAVIMAVLFQKHTRLPVIGGGVVLLLLAGALATVFGRRLARAIGRLSASARSLGRQDLSRIGGSGIAEVDAAEREIAEAVSERLKAQEALRESEATFRLLFSHNPLPMWVYDVETLYVLEVNSTAVAHYGYRRDEFLRMRISDIQPPEDAARLEDVVATT
ncbi:MAG: hypothetical protein DMD86_03235, partial [Candidatus Rokuibacteriota bacterium]